MSMHFTIIVSCIKKSLIMIISFWTGFFLFIIVAIGIIVLATWIGKKISKTNNGAGAGIIGFFLGIGFIFTMFFTCGRLYVVTGDAEFTDYFVLSSTDYEMRTGESVRIEFEDGFQTMVINNWSKPVIVEAVVYGGYGFGGDTYWLDPQEADFFEESRIFYFYDDEPPNEITINSDDDEITRLWLRNKRD